MSATEVVKTFITAVQSGDISMAANYMADDFVYRGWTLQPLGKGDFLALQSQLHATMPDFSYNLSDVQEQNNVVQALTSITGTQKNELSLPLFGLPRIESTGLAITLPQVHTTFVCKGDKIVEMEVESVPGGGLSGLLQQLGAELPVPPRLRVFKQMGDTPISQEIEAHDQDNLFGIHAPAIDDNMG